MAGLQIAFFKLRRGICPHVIVAELAEALAADLVVSGLGRHAQAGQHGRGQLAS